MKTKCPCEGVTFLSQPEDGWKCPKCGRTFKTWSNSPPSWHKDPAVAEVEKLYKDGRAHFLQIEKKLNRMERLFLEKFPRPKRKTKEASNG